MDKTIFFHNVPLRIIFLSSIPLGIHTQSNNFLFPTHDSKLGSIKIGLVKLSRACKNMLKLEGSSRVCSSLTCFNLQQLQLANNSWSSSGLHGLWFTPPKCLYG
ncbi:uncharacterized protein M6B38_312720 [Iris pallida]|uniref:Uncharacterized protein n=1 Tax=Iris pallida TaxID=29817 RepID=A0AAX6HHD5_IRIPA|nr:uncharacterized protein M6B38_312720 [Iris pallida]